MEPYVASGDAGEASGRAVRPWSVMAGLDPATHVPNRQDVDASVEHGQGADGNRLGAALGKATESQLVDMRSEWRTRPEPPSTHVRRNAQPGDSRHQ